MRRPRAASGEAVAEVVGRTLYDLLPPEMAAVRMEHVREVVRTGKPVRYDDERLGRYYESTVHPVVDEQGKVAAIAVFSIDRTERKRAEERLQRAHDELERRVEDRTNELSQANQRLRSESPNASKPRRLSTGSIKSSSTCCRRATTSGR